MDLMMVPIKDIRPDKNNPRIDFDDIEGLAASFKLNPIEPGQPLNPIVTVRDGNVYRIVDGERRFRAMKSLGAIECWSVVCDDFDEGASVVQMLATDNKRQLSEQERSRGVQTMLTLGVDEETVEKAGRVKGAGRIKRAMGLTIGAPQMSLDHLLAIAEADEAGDEEAVKELARASEDRWMAVAQKAKHRRKVAAEAAEAEQIAKDAGFELLEEAPEDGALGQRRYLGRFQLLDADEMADLYADGYHHLLIERESWGITAYAFMDQGCTEPGMEPDPEAEERARRQEEAEAKLKAIDADAAKWLGRLLAEGNTGGAVGMFFDERFPDSETSVLLDQFRQMSGVDLVAGSRPPVLVAMLLTEEWPVGRCWLTRAAVGEPVTGFGLTETREWLEFHNMLCSAGWPAPEVFAEVKANIEKAIAGEGAEDAGSDDND